MTLSKGTVTKIKGLLTGQNYNHSNYYLDNTLTAPSTPTNVSVKVIPTSSSQSIMVNFHQVFP